MKQILLNLKNNRVINILLNPLGTISRKEYWFGILFLLLLTYIPYQGGVLAGINMSIAYGNDWDPSFISAKMIITNSLNTITSLPIIPYQSIVFYSSFILTFKRSRGTLSTPTQWILGLLTWLTFGSLAGLPVIVSLLEQGDYLHEIVQQTLIFFCILFVLGVISILITAFCKDKDATTGEETPFNSINYLFKTYTLQFTFAIIFIIYLFMSGTYSFFIRPPTNPYVITIAVLYLFGFLYLISQRAKDAGIPTYLPLITFLLVSFIITIYYTFVTDLLTSQSLSSILIPLIVPISINILNILYVILIILPTKEDLITSKDVTL